MAAIAEKYSSYVFVTSDNPRSESINEINHQVEVGFSDSNDCYALFDKREEAIQAAVNMAESSDCILVAGKGHEKTQIIGDQVISFDDVEALAKALSDKEVQQC